MDLNRKIFLGFIRVHILHHADEFSVYGVWMIEELDRHGYHVSPGTLYPILHGLEKDGLLRSNEILEGGKIRKYYRTTSKGKKALKDARKKVEELYNEVVV